MQFNQEAFNEFIIRNRIVGFKPEAITLKSGRKSHCYVNWRLAVNDAYFLDQVTDTLLDFARAQEINVRSFYGVPEGATKLGILTQYKWAKQQPDYAPHAYMIPMGRAIPKEHGDPKDKFFVGVPQAPVVVLEDTTTTGGSLLNTVESLQAADIAVAAAVALTNRNELRDDGLSVPQALEKKGVPYFALSNLKDLLPAAYEALQPSPEVRQAVEAYFAEYGAL